MTTEEVLDYVFVEVSDITKKYSQICEIKDGYCAGRAEWYEKDSMCCRKCNHHNIKCGCTIKNVCCKSWFCDRIKHKIEPEDLKTLTSILTTLKAFGLDGKQLWGYQVRVLEGKRILFNVSCEELLEIFKRILHK